MILAGICIYIVLALLQLFGVFLGHRYKSYFSVILVQYCIGDRYKNYTGCRYDIFMMTQVLVMCQDCTTTPPTLTFQLASLVEFSL